MRFSPVSDRSLGLLVTALLAISAVACSSGGPGELSQSPSSRESTVEGSDSTDQGKSPAASTNAQTPATANTSDTTAGMGPECTAYFACCDAAGENAGATGAQVTQACDAARTQFDQAKNTGASMSTVESSCKSALSSMKSAGLCD